VPRLILINGPPAAGKSTLAQRYADDHPLALNLDIDRIRAMIGGWRQDLPAAGSLARDLAVAAADVHLTAGHDVVIPQLVARPEFIARLASLAAACGAGFREVFLLPDERTVVGLYASRARAAGQAGSVDAALSTDRTPADLSRARRELLAVLAGRPDAAVILVQAGEIDEAYQQFLDNLDEER
jgi:predicted kinase